MDYFGAFKNFVREEKIDKKQAIFFNGRATTYGEIISEAEKVSSALTRHGVKKGEVVSLYLDNCEEFLSIFLGVARSGAIAAPINTLLTEYEIQPQLQKTHNQE